MTKPLRLLLTSLIALGAANLVQAQTLPQLRVLTYNIHHGEGMDGKFDYSRLAKVILSGKPDVVVLQEVDKKTRRADGADQAALLGELTGMNSAYGLAMHYSGGEYGEAILSRFPIQEPKSHPLPYTTGREPRALLTAAVKPDNGLPEFVLAGTHLCHQSDEVRADQARRINELLPAEGPAHHPRRRLQRPCGQQSHERTTRRTLDRRKPRQSRESTISSSARKIRGGLWKSRTSTRKPHPITCRFWRCWSGWRNVERTNQRLFAR